MTTGTPPSERDQGRRLAAIVSADVVGYSRLMGADEHGTLTALKAHIDEFIAPAIAGNKGRIVKTIGDGLLLEFASVVDAVRCSILVQQGMFERNRDVAPERRMQFRIGINVGDVIVIDDDIFGNGVNIAARLESIADPGGICLSRAAADQIAGRLPVELEDLGDVALKNIERPVHAFRIVPDGGPAATGPAGGNARATGEGAKRVTPDLALPALPSRPALAIMPFRNISGRDEDAFIANGIGLGIQTLLVQLSGLFVVNANQHAGYVAGTTSAIEAVKDLPVSYVLEGAAQRAGDLVRVTVQLSSVADGTMVWADTYERDLEDVFGLQDDVAREIVFSLGSEVLGVDLDRIWTSGLAGRGAWRHFLEGLSRFYKFERRDNAVARASFEKLHELYPESAIAASYVAASHWFDFVHGWSGDPAASLEAARSWADKAIRSTDINNGLGHVVMGSILIREGRHDEGLALAKHGASYRPNCPLTLGQLAEAQLFNGDSPGAIRTARDALALRMMFPPSLVNVLAAAYRDNNQVDLSIPAAEEAARLDPQRPYPFVTLCSDFALAGQDEEARRTATEIAAAHPDFRVSSYVDAIPYRDKAWSERLADVLRGAGLPD